MLTHELQATMYYNFLLVEYWLLISGLVLLTRERLMPVKLKYPWILNVVVLS